MTRTRAILLPLAATAAAVGVWWWATTVLASSKLLRAFAPQHAVPAIGDLVRQGVLWDDVRTSVWRLLLGLVIGAVAGVVLGLVVGSSAGVDAATRPLFNFLRMVSPLSWAPVAIGLFGIGDRPVYLLIAAATVWPVLLNTAAGVRELDRGYLLAARTLGASRWETLRFVVLPAVRPRILTGVRLALGIGWVVLVPAEMLGVTSGLGYEILNARDQLAYDRVMALILVIGVLGYVLDTLARQLLRGRGAATRSRGRRSVPEPVAELV